jgi:crossover junction endodeoxyribonuclease RusA
MPVIEFSCYGEPQPQGSARALMLPGKKYPSVFTDNPQLKKWREKVALQAKEAMRTRGLQLFARDVPLRVDLAFYFKRPKSVRDRIHPTVKPDKDKLERAVLDALTGAIYADDAQVTQGETSKFYGEWECVKIKVMPVPIEVKL